MTVPANASRRRHLPRHERFEFIEENNARRHGSCSIEKLANVLLAGAHVFVQQFRTLEGREARANRDDARQQDLPSLAESSPCTRSLTSERAASCRNPTGRTAVCRRPVGSVHARNSSNARRDIERDERDAIDGLPRNATGLSVRVLV